MADRPPSMSAGPNRPRPPILPGPHGPVAVAASDPTPEEERAAWPDQEWRDPALEADLHPTPWLARLALRRAPSWSAATEMRLVAPQRTRREGRTIAVLEEAAVVAAAFRLPEPSLNPMDEPVPLVERVRGLHRRVLTNPTPYPIDATWTTLAGGDAVLDTFARRPAGPVAAFSLSRAVTDELGLYAAAWAPHARGPALMGPVLDLSRRVDLEEGGVLAWVHPYGWEAVERLLLTTDHLAATMSIEALPRGVQAAQWHREVVERLGFLRDVHRVAHRAIDMDGLQRGQLSIFDWQPMMSGRRFSVVVSGVVDGAGVTVQHHRPAGPTAVPAEITELLRCLVVRPRRRSGIFSRLSAPRNERY